MLAFGPERGILINALIYLPLVLWLWKAPFNPRARYTAAMRGLADIVAAVRAIAHNRTIVSMTLLAGGASLFVGNAYQAQMPEFAHDLGHGHADIAYSMLLAADAAGSLIAGIVLESRGLLRAKPKTAFILAMLWCCAIGGFAASTSYPLAFGLLLVAGFVQLSFSSMAQTLVQINAPADMCEICPTPADAYVSWPGRFRARSISSRRFLTGTDGWVSKNDGPPMRLVIAVKSRNAS